MAAKESALVLFGAGLAGSIHCVAMCGGIVAALASARAPGAVRGRFWGDQALFHAGKIATYAFLGAMAGALGAGLAGSTGLLAAQRVFALFSGAILLGFGARLFWPAFRGKNGGFGAPPLVYPRPIARRPAARAFASALAAALRAGGPAAPFTAGLLAGFLPCGLVYAAAAAAAASANAVEGAGLMAAFGLGTLPALLLASGGARLFVARSFATERARSVLARAGGLFAIGLGLVSLLRGALSLAAGGAGGGCPGCG